MWFLSIQVVWWIVVARELRCARFLQSSSSSFCPLIRVGRSDGSPTLACANCMCHAMFITFHHPFLYIFKSNKLTPTLCSSNIELWGTLVYTGSQMVVRVAQLFIVHASVRLIANYKKWTYARICVKQYNALHYSA